MPKQVINKSSDLSRFEGVRVRIVRAEDTVLGEQGAIYTGRLSDGFHCPALRGVVSMLDLEALGDRPGGKTSVRLPYGSTVEIIEEAGDA